MFAATEVCGIMRRVFRLRRILFFTALLLLISFAWHEIDFDHDHPHALFGNGVQALLHGENKKWWAILLLAALAVLRASLWRVGIVAPDAGEDHFLKTQGTALRAGFARALDPLNVLLRRGIMHPKLCD